MASEKVTVVVDLDTEEDVIAATDAKKAMEVNNLGTLVTERQLIRLVRDQPALYDSRNPHFQDDGYKDRAWHRICQRLNAEMSECLSAWAELRHRFQRHVRRLHAHNQSVTEKKRRRRPNFIYEEEMLFLYPHVSRFTHHRCTPVEVTEFVAHTEPMPDVVIVEPTIDVIDVELVGPSKFQCTKNCRKLIEAVLAYPQLYDPTQAGYENQWHVGVIWSSIANELRDKGTKLMKMWLKLVIRYEWELNHTTKEEVAVSELCQLMLQLKPHVMKRPGTVYKVSKYLKGDWNEPIEHFKTVQLLIDAIQSDPELVAMVEDHVDSSTKPPCYDEVWHKIGEKVGCCPQRCEVTWLVMRAFHNDLMRMRNAGYQLQDKWFFEHLIHDIFKTYNSRDNRKSTNKRTLNGDLSASEVAAITTAGEPPAKKPSKLLKSPGVVSALSATSKLANPPKPLQPPKPIHSKTGIPPKGILPPKGISSPKVIIPLKGNPSPKVVSSLKVIPPKEASLPKSIPSSGKKVPFSQPKLPPPPRLPLAIVYPPAKKFHTPTTTPSPNPSSTPSRANDSPSTSSSTWRQGAPATTGNVPVAASSGSTEEISPPVFFIPKTPGAISAPSPSQKTPAASSPANVPPLVPNGFPAGLTVRPKIGVPTPPLPVVRAVALPIRNHQTPQLPAKTSLLEVVLGEPGLRKSQEKTPPTWPSLGLQVRLPHHGNVPLKSSVQLQPQPVVAMPSLPAPPNVSAPMVVIQTSALPSGWEIAGPVNATAKKKPAPDVSNPGKSVTISLVSSQAAQENTTSSIAEEASPAATPSGTSQIPQEAPKATKANSKQALRAYRKIAPAPQLPKPPVAATPTPSPSTAAPSEETDSSSEAEQSVGAIRVRLMESNSGRLLVAWGGGLINRYHFNMVRTALLIQEIMAVPQLHKKDAQLADKRAEFWSLIAKKFQTPDEAVQACWKFLAKNMSFFPSIAPMSELMGPYKSSLKVWEKSNRLFSKFDEIARKYKWMEHREKLPDLIRHFQRHEHLYWEMRSARPGESEPQLRQYTDLERQEVWREAKIKFPNLNHRDIWSMFKFAFRTYMEDLEHGVENPWPQNWWRALEQLRFLIDVRYHPLEPLYYIVHQKVHEEVKRCCMYEDLMSSADQGEKRRATSHVLKYLSKRQLPWESEEAKRLLTGRLSGHEAGSVELLNVSDSDDTPTPNNTPKPAPDSAPVPVPPLVPTQVGAPLPATTAAPIPAPAPVAAPASVAAPPATVAVVPSSVSVHAPVCVSIPMSVLAPASPARSAAASLPVAARATSTLTPASTVPVTTPTSAPSRTSSSSPISIPDTPPSTAPAPGPSVATSSAPAPAAPIPKTASVVVAKPKAAPAAEVIVKAGRRRRPGKSVLIGRPKRYCLPSLDAFQVTRVLRSHPQTYKKATTIEKRADWVRVSKQLDATVTECRLGLQHALREMRILKIVDPTNRCTMGHKYYRYMNEMYTLVKPQGQGLIIRTPQQLNQLERRKDDDDDIDTVDGKHFRPEINTTNCELSLVLKNWAQAVGAFPAADQDELAAKLSEVFDKYEDEVEFEEEDLTHDDQDETELP
ncbi:hypothetical protein KR074_011361 [Drosophila pseudoananassae]|nr:hypothetical protein KR074_011361 [Drosophila pseudoananassae]